MEYVARRLLATVPVLIGVSILIFVMLNIIPGDPVTVMMKERISPDVVEKVKAQMGLDDPLIVRYFRFIGGALRGDFGISYKLNRPVSQLIIQAFPNTLALALAAALVSWLIGIPAGVLSALKPNTIIDRAFMGFSVAGISMPIFWSALLMQYLFALKLGWLPVSGFYGAKYLLMPALALGWNAAGIIARLSRSSLLDVMQKDYIRTARAKGLSEAQVVVCHALKNAFLPVVTVMAIQVASFLSGAVITESVFGIPGLGRLAIDAIRTRDMPLLEGSVLFATFLVVMGNAMADILYSTLDPRIRYGS